MPLRTRTSARRRVLLAAVLAAVAVLLVPLTTAAGARAAAPTLGWRLLDTGSTSHFRGLAVVDRNTAWVGGYNGTILRTVDGGRTWADVSPSRPSYAQFRDIAATDAQHAVAMSAGTGPASRLYRTTDGGRTWTVAYRNDAPTGFFDCMSFSDASHGLVMSDPVDGRFRIVSTSDGGATWTVLPGAGMPAALPGEAGFAASGECLTTLGRDAWFGTGGGATARVFHSADAGVTWTAEATPLTSSPSAGVFGLAFRTPYNGVAVGGDYAAPDVRTAVAATKLVANPWQPATTEPGGYRSGVTWVPGTAGTLIAVGLNGSDVSVDGGRTWRTFDTGQFDTVTCTPGGVCWASGALGRVAVLTGDPTA